MTLSYWNGTILGPYKVNVLSSRPTSKTGSTVCPLNADPITLNRLPLSNSIIKSVCPVSTKITVESTIYLCSKTGKSPPLLKIY